MTALLDDGTYAAPPGKLATIVTHLQMTAPAPLRPEAVGPPWRLDRWARPSVEAYRALFTRVGADWLWFSRLQLNDAALRAVLHDAAVEVYALEAGGRAEGLLEMDFRILGEAQLVYFGVTAPLIGQGAGRWLMNRALERAWARPIRRLWVHTCTLDHPGALAFYLRSGFQPYRQEVEVADDPRRLGHLPMGVAPHAPLL